MTAKNNNYFLEALEKIEAVHKERTSVEINMAYVCLHAALGDIWCRKYVYLGPTPDPFMLNGNDAWLKANPVPEPDMRRVIYASRVISLSDALFTLIPKVTGFEKLRQRFQKRKDIRALFNEAQIASLLVRNGVTVQIIGEAGKRGEDFDLLVTVKGVPIGVEVTGIEGGTLSVRPILNKLKSKRGQVSANRPAVLYVIVPETWMKNYTAAFLRFNQAIESFMRRSKRFNAIVLIWGGVRAGEGGGWMRGSLQPVFNNFPRWRIPDLSVFGLKPDKWGKLRYSNSLVDALRAFRLKNQFRDD